MAIQYLTDEQVRTWTLEQKDRWWFENVYRGDMPQLTLRAAISGMMIGGILSVTNLYVGIKTGWTLGVGITSVIIAFATFKLMARIGLARDFSILENNCMQSIATAAGYMTSPLISSLAAYMMITDRIVPMATSILWMIAISVLGVLFAFPLKKRFINDEQHQFPEGRAAGVVMDALHTSDVRDGFFKAQILGVCAGGSAVMEFLKQGDLLAKIHMTALELPHAMEDRVFKWMNWVPKIRGTPIKELTLTIEPDHVMMATGGLMGIRTGVWLLIGAVVNYAMLSPWAIAHGDVFGVAGPDGGLAFGFRRITSWALWPGVACMTTASIFSFLSKPKMILGAFSGLFGKRGGEDILRNIELPMSVFLIGIPIVGTAVVSIAHVAFGVEIWHGILAIPLVFVFTIIAAHSTALTSITPTGALGKLTQLTFAALTPSASTNLITASITGEVAGNASNLLMDIKPGYMLGGKPRQQAIGHVFGIIAGSLVCVPIFYYAYLQGGPSELIKPDQPFPAATIWKSVAEILTRGISELPTSAVYATAIGAVLGIVMEWVKVASKGKIPVSAVGFGLAFVIQFSQCFAMFLGAFIFWAAATLCKKEGSIAKRLLVDNLEPICAGIIAGGALMGIGIALWTAQS